MKLKEGFITHESYDEQIMVAVGVAAEKFHGLVRSNQTAAFIIDCLKKDDTKQQILERILDKYDASYEVVLRDLEQVLLELVRIGAVDES